MMKFKSAVENIPRLYVGLFLVGMCFVVLIGILALGVFFKSTTSTKIEKTTTSNYPNSYFEVYKFDKEKVSIPKEVNVYKLKSKFDEGAIREFSKKFGLNQFKKTETDYDITYNGNSMGGMVVFNRQTGTFLYQSYGNLTPKNFKRNQDAAAAASQFVSEMGFDNLIVCGTTYKRKGLDDVTFVECRRDWSKAGLPIFNFAGLLNLPENIRLDDVEIGRVDSFTPEDSAVYNVLHKSVVDSNAFIADILANGKMRPSDFNTMTFAIGREGKIISIDSRMRWIESVEKVKSDKIIADSEAIKRFRDHQSELSLTLLAGIGTVDYSRVYLNNQAKAREAKVMDYSLAYLEKSSTTKQDYLVPSYVIRGLAELESGYTVRFVEEVPALKDGKSFVASGKGEVAGVLAQANDPSLQLLPLDVPSPSAVPSSSPGTTPPPPVAPGSTPPSGGTIPLVTPPPHSTSTQCAGFDGGLGDLAFRVEGVGEIVLARGAPEPFSPGWAASLFFKSASFPHKDMEQIQDLFFKSLEDQSVIDAARVIAKSNAGNSLRSVDDVYNFMRNNKISVILDPRVLEWSQDYIHKDPVAHYYYRLSRKKVIVQNTAIRIVDLIKNGKLQEWSGKADVFPTSSIVDPFIDASDYFRQEASGACYVSGVSPVIFVYSKNGERVKVWPTDNLTYAYPVLGKSGWEVSGGYGKLYYEYHPKVDLNEEVGEAYLHLSQISSFVDDVSNKLGLNTEEKKGLIQEFNRELSQAKFGKFVKISLIDPEEVEKKLELKINPKPTNLYRYHFVIKPVEELKVGSGIDLPVLKRDGITVIEFGVRVRD